MPDKSKKYSHIIKTILAGTSIFLVGSLAFITLILSYEIRCHDLNGFFTVQKGATIKDVAIMLEERACIPHRSVFTMAMLLTLKDRELKAGRYTLKGIRTVRDLIRMVTNPSAERVRVTIFEGSTMESISKLLEDKLQIDSYHFKNLCYDHNFIQTLGVLAPSLEGFLYPDTYIFLTSYTEEDILQILVNQFNYVYNKNIKPMAKKTGMSKLEITTLASIIQGEAIFSDEMPLISSVFHNRLRKNMLLQADPTIQYILPNRKKRLYQKDLKTDSPYNTYLYRGLPPGPINNPGLDALRAAANPAETDNLYFVADGKGRHIFTKSNEDHNRARYEVKKRKRNRK